MYDHKVPSEPSHDAIALATYPSAANGPGAAAQLADERWPDPSFAELPRRGGLHNPVGPDPVAQWVVTTICLMILLLGATCLVFLTAVLR
jgi:hypothetical protein